MPLTYTLLKYLYYGSVIFMFVKMYTCVTNLCPFSFTYYIYPCISHICHVQFMYVCIASWTIWFNGFLKINFLNFLNFHICDLINAIFESGIFPDKWTEGFIVPIHKKGDVNNVQNYRGITLVSCLSKLFTSILNKRLEAFCDNNNVISDAQFGFRKGKSTVDAIYILHSIVQRYINNNERLSRVQSGRSQLFCQMYSDE